MTKYAVIDTHRGGITVALIHADDEATATQIARADPRGGYIIGDRWRLERASPIDRRPHVPVLTGRADDLRERR